MFHCSDGPSPFLLDYHLRKDPEKAVLTPVEVYQSRLSVRSSRQGDSTEPQIFSFTLEELQGAQTQRLGTQGVFVAVELSSTDGTLAAAVQFPEVVLVILDEADVVKVNIVLGVRCCCVTTRGCFSVCSGEVGCLLE